MSGDKKGVSGNLGESLPRKCKDPEAGTRWACFWKEEEAEQARRKAVVEEVERLVESRSWRTLLVMVETLGFYPE